jgi:hypothetical protein
MDINILSSWIYLALTVIILLTGLDILIHKRGGVYVWQKPYGYKIEYYKGSLLKSSV